jgi:cellulose synthase/poly-beta-1,6-N-acetylglucosamine synthase-like glycosyltransferase
MSPLGIVGRGIELALLSAWSLFGVYVLLLTVVATRQRAENRVPASRLRRLGILIPAHDEEIGLGATLGSLALQDYPKDLFEVIVIADNCQDRTAEIARGLGATVLERTDPTLRGKNHALGWGLTRLARLDYPHDAYVILDADSLTTPNLLEVVNRYVEQGWEAIQVHNAVRNPRDSWMTGLRYASFASYSYLRPLGRTRLGSTAKLQGNGMGLTAGLLRRHPWRSLALAEDFDYSAELAANGVRVAFAPEGEVRSEMPLTLERAHSQLSRWERGRWQVFRRHVLRLLSIAFRERSLWRAEVALDLLVPPLSFLISLPWFFFALEYGLHALNKGDAWSGILASLWGGVEALYVIHLAAALLVVKAPAVVYRSLLCAPLYVAKLLRIYLGLLLGQEEKSWVRTPRAKGKGEQT